MVDADHVFCRRDALFDHLTDARAAVAAIYPYYTAASTAQLD